MQAVSQALRWVLTIVLALSAPALAQKKYDPGASDTEIRIGQTMSYSGPGSPYGTLGRVAAAYFKKINDLGGINGRRITFISLDDGFSPARTLELTRRLVERDEVLLLFNSLGTAPNSAVHRYLNEHKVPQLFVASGVSKWNDPQRFPWTMGWQPSYVAEGRIFARHVVRTRPSARIAVLYQNDDFGKELLQGFQDALGDKKGLVVAAVSYEVTDPTVDSQIVQLRASGADVLVNFSSARFAAQAIRKAYDIGWRPVQYLTSVSSSVASVLTPAGLEKADGLLSAGYLKDPTDPQWAADASLKEWAAFMAQYYPEGSVADITNVVGYATVQTLVEVLKRCGDRLTRENVMQHAASLSRLQIGTLLPGVTIDTNASDFAPIETMQMMRFNGKRWERFGDVIGG